MSTRHLLALALVTVLLAAGCSEGQITKTEGDVRIWLHESGFASGGEDAEIIGTMAYDLPTRCMYLEVDGRFYPVVWPTGTRIESGDPITIKTKGQMIEEGDFVMGGGGYHRPDMLDGLIPDECHGTTSEVAVFNADSEIEVTRP
jgi:hypothetical protein